MNIELNKKHTTNKKGRSIIMIKTVNLKKFYENLHITDVENIEYETLQAKAAIAICDTLFEKGIESLNDEQVAQFDNCLKQVYEVNKWFILEAVASIEEIK